MAVALPYRATAAEAIGGLLRLRFLGLLRLVMPDQSACRGARNSVSVADLMAGDGADRSPFRGAGGLLVGIAGRVCANGETYQNSSQNNTSH
jgi:hypothetical protein